MPSAVLSPSRTDPDSKQSTTGKSRFRRLRRHPSDAGSVSSKGSISSRASSIASNISLSSVKKGGKKILKTIRRGGRKKKKAAEAESGTADTEDGDVVVSDEEPPPIANISFDFAQESAPSLSTKSENSLPVPSLSSMSLEFSEREGTEEAVETNKPSLSHRLLVRSAQNDYNLGVMYISYSDGTKATEKMMRALSARSSLYGEDDFRVAQCHEALGDVKANLTKETQEAKDRYQQALNIFQSQRDSPALEADTNPNNFGDDADRVLEKMKSLSFPSLDEEKTEEAGNIMSAGSLPPLDEAMNEDLDDTQRAQDNNSASCSSGLYRVQEENDETEEPDVAEPDSTEPDSTEPEPTQPEPTQPEPTQPEPTQPDPTESDSAEPDSTESQDKDKIDVAPDIVLDASKSTDVQQNTKEIEEVAIQQETTEKAPESKAPEEKTEIEPAEKFFLQFLFSPDYLPHVHAHLQGTQS